jgi:hypothetical protein
MYAPGASRRRAIVFYGCRYDQAIVSTRLYFRLFPLFCALFFPLAFSFAISMTFPVFGAPDAL